MARTVGWSRGDWEALAGGAPLGGGLPAHRPGCGSLSVDPARADVLRVTPESLASPARSGSTSHGCSCLTPIQDRTDNELRALADAAVDEALGRFVAR